MQLVYMAPERLMHGQMFPAGDVYAFGIMLWEMYHGAVRGQGLRRITDQKGEAHTAQQLFLPSS